MKIVPGDTGSGGPEAGADEWLRVSPETGELCAPVADGWLAVGFVKVKVSVIVTTLV